ncbi:MAG TPA: metallophosphoesterase, partial [Burkholderiaceae bacterium]|nr:metallophosphoesterase [Burkholderiaceae bacterium]
LILSDLHVEFAPFAPARADFDVVVLAGDIHQAEQALHWARATFPQHPIVQIAGNHEFYDQPLQPALARMRQVGRRLGIEFLERDSADVGGVRFFGCTMWTDFRIYDRPGRPLRMDVAQAMQASRRRVLDFATVRWKPRAGELRGFEPADAIALHRRARRWLVAQLDAPFDGKRVVVTHHLPSWRSVVPPFLDSPVNPAFASDLDPLLERVDLWIHGHAHSSIGYRAGRARVVCNPRGYPRGDGRFENPRFDPALVVTV